MLRFYIATNPTPCDQTNKTKQIKTTNEPTNQKKQERSKKKKQQPCFFQSTKQISVQERVCTVF